MASRYFEPFRHRDFALLWSGLRVDRHPIGLSYVLAARLLPAVVFVLLGGAIVDRVPRRLAMLGSDLARGAALGDSALDTERIGSTSVPGLAAKSIVDVVLTVADVDNEAAYVPALTSVGFVLRVREPEHRMLRTPAQDVHLHVYEPDRPEVRDYLDLRAWLRVDTRDRELYAATKRRLARQQWTDMNHYADAKTEVICDVLTRARAWREVQRRLTRGCNGFILSVR
ncbi:MAG: GrpB family protein [Actinomycetes bacterium]